MTATRVAVVTGAGSGIGRAIAYFVSDEAGPVTGRVIGVNGGRNP
jgi:NAD(P)-dependent dehydrogenase (short-subunit alcohol dehydrogenase family)